MAVNEIDEGRKELTANTRHDFGDPSASLWDLYNQKTDKYDRDLVERWKGNMDGILIFTGLFSATVAAFTIESYRSLQPDPTELLLTQISGQLAALANGTAPLSQPLSPKFRVPSAMLRVNIFWFLSLIVSISCALAAILIQQWSRRYLTLTRPDSSAYRRARARTFFHAGVVKFSLSAASDFIPVLLHASAFLFFAGLIQFAFAINDVLAWCLLAAVTVVVGTYATLSAMPVFSASTPYFTPISAPLWTLSNLLLTAVLTFGYSIANCVAPVSSATQHVKNALRKVSHRLRQGFAHGSAGQSGQDLDYFALSWLSRRLTDENDLIPFADAIPGYLQSQTTLQPIRTLVRVIHENEIGRGFGSLLFLASRPGEQPDPVRTRRALIFLDAFWHLAATCRRLRFNFIDLDPSGHHIIATRWLRFESDVTVSFMAHCLTAVRVASLLASIQSAENDAERDKLILFMPSSVSEVSAFRGTRIECDAGLVAINHLIDGVLLSLDTVHDTRIVILIDTLQMLTTDIMPSRASPHAQSLFADTLVALTKRHTAADSTHLKHIYDRLVHTLAPVAPLLSDEHAIEVANRALGQEFAPTRPRLSRMLPSFNLTLSPLSLEQPPSKSS